MNDQPTCKVYFAGELFSTKHLLGNAALAEAIRRRSGGRFAPFLPQTLAQHGRSAHAIRDQDLRALLSCDLGLFHYDGPELDSGTVVEFMYAKFADIPAVLLRTDFRGGGEQAPGGDPWNLMTSFHPRTVTLVLDAMSMYHGALGSDPGELSTPTDLHGAQGMVEQTAAAVIDALERVRAMPPVLPADLREAVYRWLALLPGFERPDPGEFLAVFREKHAQGLL